MKKTFIILLFSVMFSMTAAAQRIISIDDLRTRINAFENNKFYSLGYLKAADQSLVYCLMPLHQTGTYASASATIGLNIGFDFQGSSFDKTLDNFSIFFHSLGSRWVFLKDEPLVAIINGRKIVLGISEKRSSIKKNFLHGSLTQESLVFHVSRTDLEKLAGAKNGELRVSDLIYKFKDGELREISNLLRLAVAE